MKSAQMRALCNKADEVNPKEYSRLCEGDFTEEQFVLLLKLLILESEI